MLADGLALLFFSGPPPMRGPPPVRAPHMGPEQGPRAGMGPEPVPRPMGPGGPSPMPGPGQGPGQGHGPRSGPGHFPENEMRPPHGGMGPGVNAMSQPRVRYLLVDQKYF